jgi:broad specificity phosphatase PhoE
VRTLILVRHSESKLDSQIPPQQWVLTKNGRKRCIPLAKRVAKYEPQVIITSEEIKARETGELLAKALELPWLSASGLHEHLREAGVILNVDSWAEIVARFFDHPGERVFGLETAEEALERFSEAIQVVMDQNHENSLIIVTHGTVMSLYFKALTGEDAYHFWRRLELPAFYTVSWPDRTVLSVEMGISD